MADDFDSLFGHNGGPPIDASEKSILNDTLVAVSALPRTIVLRNNTGQAWQGRKVAIRAGTHLLIEPGMIILQDARPITFGLQGSGDILGVSDGRAISIEVKNLRGVQSKVQQRFERAWTRAGGLYVLARSPEDALSKLR